MYQIITKILVALSLVAPVPCPEKVTLGMTMEAVEAACGPPTKINGPLPTMWYAVTIEHVTSGYDFDHYYDWLYGPLPLGLSQNYGLGFSPDGILRSRELIPPRRSP